MNKNLQAPGDTPFISPTPFDEVPPIRLAVGLADPERERVLLPSLSEHGDFLIAERCLAADQLLECLRSGRIEAVLLAFDLHRLSEGTLMEMGRTGVPLVMLAPQAVDRRSPAFPGMVLPLEATPESVQQALRAVVRGERPVSICTNAEPELPPVETTVVVEEKAAGVIAVTSGWGSPGRTTLALNLAAALGAVAPTVLVDADLSGPSIAAHLDADPTRNLYMLAHAEPATAAEWARAIELETQPIAGRSARGVALCGIPKPEMRGGVSDRFFEQLIVELQQSYRYVVLDIGADLLGPEVTLHRSALRLAHQILLVASADLTGIWRGRAALALLQTHVPVDRVALVVNRHARRYHHSRAEIEWGFGLPAAAIIPFDHGGVQRALAAQRPVVLDDRSSAGRAILDLSERVLGGRIALPPEPAGDGPLARLQRLVPWPKRVGQGEKGVPRGDEVASLS